MSLVKPGYLLGAQNRHYPEHPYFKEKSELFLQQCGKDRRW